MDIESTPHLATVTELVRTIDEPNEADDDVQGGHPLLVPRTKSDNHQLEGNGI